MAVQTLIRILTGTNINCLPSQRFLVAFLVLIGAYYYKFSTSFVRKVPVVSTQNGELQGGLGYTREGRIFYEYLGIPYAAPPVGPLRFEPPEEPLSWEGVRDARFYGSQCIQVEFLFGVMLGNEDCLFLNVFTPQINPRRKLPVMVYIHGGLYVNGGSDIWRPTYFLEQDVVLVTINYRLAALGFLSTGDGVVRGNMALKDQSMALKWVQNNIDNFGGDKSSVTIFGESVGGVSAHFHILSPMSKDLFHRAISQSGTAFHFWTMNDNNEREQALRLGKILGCPTNSTIAMVQCLKVLDASKIVDVHKEAIDPLRDHITIFKPTVEIIDDEKSFMSKTPEEIVKSGNFNKVPWISGVNSEEGLITAAAIMANQTLRDLAKNDWNEFARKLLLFSNDDATTEKIKEFYFGDCTSTDCQESFTENIQRYSHMVSDRAFFADFHHGVKLQKEFAPVYLYYYSYVGEWSVANLFMEVRGTLPRLMEAGWAVVSTYVTKSILGRKLPNYGTSHGDELALFFEMPWICDVFPGSNDFQMSKDLVKLWVSFANNSYSLEFRNTSWAPLTPRNIELHYLNINTKSEMIPEPFTNRVLFWDSLSLINY